MKTKLGPKKATKVGAESKLKKENAHAMLARGMAGKKK